MEMATGAVGRQVARDRNGRSRVMNVLERLDRAWEDLLESYAGLSDAEMLEPGVTRDWSVRDIIAHVTWWEEEALTHLPLILAGGKPPRYSVSYGGIDAFNALMTGRRKSLPLAEAFLEPR
jgi:hypothetical protein